MNEKTFFLIKKGKEKFLQAIIILQICRCIKYAKELGTTQYIKHF